MKQRLLVMNGQRLVQSEQAGQWHTDKVEKAGTVKPGIYNIHFSQQADKAKAFQGTVIHADKEHVYQLVGKSFVKHSLMDFDKVPEIGSVSKVTYVDKKAVVSTDSVKLGRKIF